MLALVLMTWLIAADEGDKYKAIFKKAGNNETFHLIA